VVQEPCGWLAWCVALLAIGCVPSVQLKPEAAKVQVGTSQPDGCKHIADIIASGTGQGVELAMVSAQNDLRNKTDTAGGNYAVIMTNNTGRAIGVGAPAHEIVLTGAAFDCANLPTPVPTITTPPPPPTAKPAGMP
jgi:Domain of unknown function (DUF4156)